MIKTKNYCISAGNIWVHEIVGLKAMVANGSDSSRIGVRGKIVDETKNTFVIETGKGEKVLPKKEIFLEVRLPERVVLDCSKIAFRPEDRTKKLWRKKNAG